jgi:hypothetical protein
LFVKAATLELTTKEPDVAPVIEPYEAEIAALEDCINPTL